MKKIEFFKADWTAVLLRFYLMMTVVIAAGFSGNWWLALFALPIFISCMLGASYTTNTEKAKNTPMTKTVKMESTSRTAA